MITIAPSFVEPNQYFIFRDHGIEVSFTIKNNLVKPSRPLFVKEMNFIRETILNQKQ